MHARVEAGLNLLDPSLDGDRLTRVLVRLAGFWLGTEPAVDVWAQADPDTAHAWDWQRRRRSDALRGDLLALGVDPDVPIAPPVFTAPDSAQVLGWLYVVEGSTLGGAVLERRLRGLTARLDVRLASFAPYDEGPGPMWRAYLAALERWTGSDDLRAERVIAASVATFDALEKWVSPVFGEAAA